MKNNKPCVYRYVDTESGITKYVGIVHKGNLEKRLMAHMCMDSWANDGCWRVEYFECESRSEAEAFESHLIALYETHKYYNKAKTNWGLNRFLPDVEKWWKVAVLPKYDNLETMKFTLFIRNLIRQERRKDVLFLLDFIDFEGD